MSSLQKEPQREINARDFFSETQFVYLLYQQANEMFENFVFLSKVLYDITDPKVQPWLSAIDFHILLGVGQPHVIKPVLITSQQECQSAF